MDYDFTINEKIAIYSYSFQGMNNFQQMHARPDNDAEVPGNEKKHVRFFFFSDDFFRPPGFRIYSH